MKKSILNEINQSFADGYIPYSLTYTLEQRCNIDFNKLWYNEYYKSVEYQSKQFPKGWQSIPFFDLVLEEMAEKSLTPLEEIEIRQQKLISND